MTIRVKKELIMLIETIIFYAFAIMFVGTAIMVVTQRNTVYSALFLVLTFFSASALWMMLEAEFLAIILVLVYVGAVMTLFLFVIMMLQLEKLPAPQKLLRYIPWGVLIVAIVVAALVYVLRPENFAAHSLAFPPQHDADYSNIRQLGMVLYTNFVYPFEIAAVLLLVAIIAAISLSLRKPRRKTQNIGEQVRVQRADRVRMIKMPSEKKQEGNS